MVDRLIDQQADVMQKAVVEFYESPRTVKAAADFAEEQGQLLQHYSPRGRIFTLTDGEPYTAEYIINHMTNNQAAQ
ncbi:hypothetical protein ACF5W4_11000 [Bacillota bacterium Lsc_1132]